MELFFSSVFSVVPILKTASPPITKGSILLAALSTTSPQLLSPPLAPPSIDLPLDDSSFSAIDTTRDVALTLALMLSRRTVKVFALTMVLVSAVAVLLAMRWFFRDDASDTAVNGECAESAEVFGPCGGPKSNPIMDRICDPCVKRKRIIRRKVGGNMEGTIQKGEKLTRGRG